MTRWENPLAGHPMINDLISNMENKNPANHLLPSLKLTWHLKITPWKRRFLLETIVFRCYVSFREGSFQGENQQKPPRIALQPGPVRLNHPNLLYSVPFSH